VRTTLVPAVVAVSLAVGSIPLNTQAAIGALLTIPLGLDLYMPVPEDNPITSDKVDLGRRLFNDRRLSRDGTVACVSCHDPDRAFSKADAISPGAFGRRGRRNAPALVNRAWGIRFSGTAAPRRSKSRC
jgi:cytochrome c peroxidase